MAMPDLNDTLKTLIHKCASRFRREFVDKIKSLKNQNMDILFILYISDKAFKGKLGIAICAKSGIAICAK